MQLKVLVTGSTGYLGSYLASDLLENGFQVFSLTRREHPLFKDHSRFHEILLDRGGVGELSERLREYGPDWIVHSAAESSPLVCENEPALAEAVHVQLTEQLCTLADLSDIPICFVSTDLVFDGSEPPHGGFREEDLPQPRSVYARTKRKGEEVTLAARKGAVLRSSLLYGPPIGPRKGNLAWMDEAFREGKELSLFFDEWRTPIHVKDVVRCISRIRETGSTGVYHASGPQRLSRVEFGRCFAKAFQYDEKIIVERSQEDVNSVPARPRDVSLNNDQTCAALGISFRPCSEALASP